MQQAQFSERRRFIPTAKAGGFRADFSVRLFPGEHLPGAISWMSQPMLECAIPCLC